MFAILRCLPPCRRLKDRVASGQGQGKLPNERERHQASNPAIVTNPWVGKVFASLIAGIFLMVGFGLWAIYTYQSKAPQNRAGSSGAPTRARVWLRAMFEESCSAGSSWMPS